MKPDPTTARQVLGLVVAMLIAGIATLAARRLHWPDMGGGGRRQYVSDPG